MNKAIKSGVVLCLVFVLTFLCSCNAKEPSLSNKNANETTKNVYSFICQTYKNKIISAQQESLWVDGPDYEMNYISKVTGKLPAMRGLDFMNDDFDGVVERSVEWWNKGGLVTICWTFRKAMNNASTAKPAIGKPFCKTEPKKTKRLLQEWTRQAKLCLNFRRQV